MRKNKEDAGRDSSEQQAGQGNCHKSASGADSGPSNASGGAEPSANPPPPSAAGGGTKTGPVKKVLVDAFFMCIFQPLVACYDLISQPIFYFKDKVYEKRHYMEDCVKSKQIDPSDPLSPWRQLYIDPVHLELEQDLDSMKNFAQLQQISLRRHASGPCYGYRQVLHEQWIKRGDSDKLQRQVRLSNYKWITSTQLDRQVDATRRGLLLSGIKAGDTVMIYADTRPEWQICSQALVRMGATVGTMFATLGVDGIVHSVNETQVTHLITQRDKVSKLLRLKSRLPKLAKIVYFDNTLDVPVELGGDIARNGDEKHPDGIPSSIADSEFDSQELGVECLPFRQLVLKGLQANQADIDAFEKRDAEVLDSINLESIAVIMYTSGSTGIPKGVLITHGAIIATTKAFSYVTKEFCKCPDENCGTAYLPLAHIFEFTLEAMMIYHGFPFGFATPHTLTDKSPGLQTGERGDFPLLKPTVTIIVPLILDRITMGIKQVVGQSPYFKSKLVTYLIDYKMYWQKRYYKTPLVDKIVCSKIAASLGGRLKYAISGSAPLSAETQNFIRAAMNVQLVEGFGSTETCASATCQVFGDMSTGNVGIPVARALIKLEPWIEGNYRPTDKPNPRGEIVIGGGGIAAGYYKLDQLTNENFYKDEDGVRWYRTGDIGEFLPCGSLKIIDRKKDLVKLQNGEFVSLGRIESSLKSNQYTDNFCVYANSNYNYTVALAPANQLALRKLAAQLVQEYDHRQMMKNSLVEEEDEEEDESREPGKSDTTKGVAERGEHGQHRDTKRQERQTLIGSRSESPDADTKSAIVDLREVLREYEDDPDVDSQQISERKMSTLSSHSVASYDERFKRLCDNKLIIKHILSQLTQLGRERNLTSLELPKKILLLAEEWTEDKNLVTGALKIRRNYIYKRYEDELKQIYKQR